MNLDLTGFKFTPGTDDKGVPLSDLQMGELPIDEVLSKVVFSNRPVIVPFEVDGKAFDINMAAIRYKVFAHQRACQCCGVVGTRMFLEPYVEEGTNIQYYRFMMYAQTRYKPRGTPHLLLMTADHLIPKSEGGTNDPENLQTYCWLCNVAKTNLKMSAQQIQDSLHLINRIFRSSYAVRKTKQGYEERGNALAKAQKDVANISKGLEKIKPEGRAALQARLDAKRIEAEALQIEYDRHLIQAQTSGVVPGEHYDED